MATLIKATACRIRSVCIIWSFAQNINNYVQCHSASTISNHAWYQWQQELVTFNMCKQMWLWFLIPFQFWFEYCLWQFGCHGVIKSDLAELFLKVENKREKAQNFAKNLVSTKFANWAFSFSENLGFPNIFSSLQLRPKKLSRYFVLGAYFRQMICNFFMSVGRAGAPNTRTFVYCKSK